MKFLHISDLHIGKILYGYDIAEDQRYILNRICEIAQSVSAEGLLIAGDVYNTPNPSGEAMAIFSDFLSFFARRNIPVYAVSGNHDSALKVSYFSSLLKDSGIFLSEEFSGKLQTFKAEDEYGEIHIHLLPFIRPAFLKRFYPEEKTDTYEEAVKTVLMNSEIDESVRNILVCHQLITGAVTGGSEELTIGGVENISPEIFSAFDYVAIGHIHSPQKAGRDEVRYCGAPLKYSQSEENNTKSITVVEINEKGNVKISVEELKPLREIKSVKGTYEELINSVPTEDFTTVTLTDEEIRPDARITLRSVFPNMISFSADNSRMRAADEPETAEDMENKSVLDIFRDFYIFRNGGNEPDESQMKIITEIFEEEENETD